MLFDHITTVYLALALRTEEGRIGEDDAANDRLALAAHHGCGQAAHGMADQYRRRQVKCRDQGGNVGSMVPILMSARWGVGLPVLACIGHHHVEVGFHGARQRRPAGAAAAQAM